MKSRKPRTVARVKFRMFQNCMHLIEASETYSENLGEIFDSPLDTLCIPTFMAYNHSHYFLYLSRYLYGNYL